MAKQVKRTTRSSTRTPTPKTETKARTSATSRTTTRSKTKQAIGVTEDQIRERAYHIFLQRNGGPGDAHSDWQQAERELRTH